MLWERLRKSVGRLPSAARGPDVALTLIPGLLMAALLASVASSLSMTSALAAGSVPASGVIGYVLFYEPPTRTIE